MTKILLIIGGGVLAVGLAVLLIWLFTRKKKTQAPVATDTPTDAKAQQETEEALIEKAKAQAKSDADNKRIDDILKIDDKAERLRRLSDEFKNI